LVNSTRRPHYLCLVPGQILRATDTSGGVIAGVKVEATNVETNVTFSGETNGRRHRSELSLH
jgi:hypothetical protein